MDIRLLIKNYLFAFLSQSISLLVSAFMTLLVPKVLGIEEFGYWQLFIFYTTYVGIFHFGLNDGVYLLQGGQSRESIDKPSIKSQFFFGALYQSLFSLVIIIFGLFLEDSAERAFVIVATGVFLILNNFTLYFGYVFQATNETRLFSFSIIIDKIAFLFPLFALVLLQLNHFEAYVLAYGFAKCCSLLFCLYCARDYLAVEAKSLRSTLREVIQSIKAGLPLMIANLADLLILGVVRYCTDAFWGIRVFGQLSLSLSLVNFFIAFIAQASMVLFPALRRCAQRELREIYSVLRDVMEVFFPAIYLLYFPLVLLIGRWLPQYSESLRLFAFLLPVCVFDSKQNICSTTYFKVLRQERILLSINVLAVILSCICCLLCISLSASVDLMIALASISVIARSFISEVWLNRELGMGHSKSVYLEMVFTLLFMIIASRVSITLGFFITLVLYIGYLFFSRKTIAKALSMASSIFLR